MTLVTDWFRQEATLAAPALCYDSLVPHCHRKRFKIMQKKTVILAVLLASVLLLAGCPSTKIGDIQKDPGKYMNKQITVTGKVSSSYGVLGMGMFQVNDGSGSLWVLSENYGVPGQGTNVNVTGQLVQTASFGGKNFSNVLRETKPRK
jgi:predicted small secreted protein